MFRNFNSLARLAVLGTGTLVVTAAYWEVLADQNIVRTPLQLNDFNFFVSYLLNFVAVMLACFAVCEIALKQYRPSIRGIIGILLLFLIVAATANFLEVPRDLWSELITHHAPPTIVLAACYYWWLGTPAWNSPCPPSSRKREVLIGNVNSDLLSAKLSLDRKVATEITELHVRANALMRRSSAVLAIIVVVLTFSATFIVVANKIAETGIVRIDPFTDLIDESNDIRHRIVNAQDKLLQLTEMGLRLLPTITALNKEIEQLEQKMVTSFPADSNDVAELASLSSTLNHHNAQIERMRKDEAFLRSELTYLEQRRKDIAKERMGARTLVLSRDASPKPKGNAELDENLSAFDLLIATGVTRFGVLIIAVYLVQILINLYRYNTRTAAYYLAHADALLLSNKNPKVMEALHKALVPDVDYGRLPRTMAQNVGTRVSTAARRFWPGRGGPGRMTRPPSA